MEEEPLQKIQELEMTQLVRWLEKLIKNNNVLLQNYIGLGGMINLLNKIGFTGRINLLFVLAKKILKKEDFEKLQWVSVYASINSIEIMSYKVKQLNIEKIANTYSVIDRLLYIADFLNHTGITYSLYSILKNILPSEDFKLLNLPFLDQSIDNIKNINEIIKNLDFDNLPIGNNQLDNLLYVFNLFSINCNLSKLFTLLKLMLPEEDFKKLNIISIDISIKRILVIKNKIEEINFDNLPIQDNKLDNLLFIAKLLNFNARKEILLFLLKNILPLDILYKLKIVNKNPISDNSIITTASSKESDLPKKFRYLSKYGLDCSSEINNYKLGEMLEKLDPISLRSMIYRRVDVFSNIVNRKREILLIIYDRYKEFEKYNKKYENSTESLIEEFQKLLK
jgi:hypothetical protein